MSVRVLAMALCCLTAGCAAAPLGPVRGPDGQLSSRVQVISASELPPPSHADLSGPARPYLIGPFDTLTIDVFGIEELSRREIRADAAGRISFPLAGTIDAAGSTPAQLEDQIEQRLRERHIRDPQVTVNLKETVSRVITVDGQVRQPGLYPVVGRMTLMRAVATAHGLSEYARQDDVVVFRTVDGQQLAALYNLQAIRRGTYEDPEVFANDVVIVGDSPARRIFRDALQLLPLLSTPLIVALQSNSTP
jgi:polysaccharide export outer membrane protein